MSIREVKAFFAARGMEDRVLEFDTSSATVELAAQRWGSFRPASPKHFPL